MSASTRSSSGTSLPTSRHVRRRKRQNALVVLIATVLGLWLGVAAPAVSPVAPAPPATPPTVRAGTQATASAPVVTTATATATGADERRQRR